jgi:hypothetical protein
MRPGQAIFDSTTIGGWYRNPELKRTLVSLGLSVSAPSDGSDFDYVLVFGIAAAGLLGAAALLFVRHQRGQRSPSTSSTELPAGSRT